MSLRKSILVFFLFLTRGICYSQADKNSPAIYNSITGITLLTSDSLQEKIGIYRLGTLSGMILKLDSTMHFTIRDYDCLSRGVVDSGSWFVYKTGRIGLKSKNGLQTFDLIKFDHFYFCISPYQRANFVADFLGLQAAFKDSRPGPGTNSIDTTIDIRAGHLQVDYYTRDLENPYNNDGWQKHKVE